MIENLISELNAESKLNNMKLQSEHESNNQKNQ